MLVRLFMFRRHFGVEATKKDISGVVQAPVRVHGLRIHAEKYRTLNHFEVIFEVFF